MSKWFTVTESKVSYRPLTGGKDNGSDEEERVRFIRQGVRINMADGGWWFHHFSANSWTYHFPLVRATDFGGRPREDKHGKPVFLPERKLSFPNFRGVVKEYGKRAPHLILALMRGEEDALEAEAEKRAGA